MKSYTDLEQSKKLAEILPADSADMYWRNGVSDKYIQCFTPYIGIDHIDYDYDVPCWSLAALLEYLLVNFHQYPINNDGHWELYDKIGIATNNDLVDACYEMILKLHEQGLI